MAKQEKWTDKLNKGKVREALQEACIDAYGGDEQHTGLLTMIENDLEFPFKARVIGQVVTIVDFEWPERDEFGLDLIVEQDCKRHRVEARSVELLPPLPKGHLYLAAYLDWKARF